MTTLTTGTVTPSDTLADDLLEGSAEIAGFLGKTKRQAEHLLETKQLPAFKIGGRWHMRRSTFRARIQKLEKEADRAAA